MACAIVVRISFSLLVISSCRMEAPASCKDRSEAIFRDVAMTLSPREIMSRANCSPIPDEHPDTSQTNGDMMYFVERFLIGEVNQSISACEMIIFLFMCLLKSPRLTIPAKL